MGRSSTTRTKTQEAADILVGRGFHPRDITVDLIAAEIQQGSRTTINDELRLWKDKKAKEEALRADIPLEIAGPVRSLWAAALERAEKVFEQRREEIEVALARAEERASGLDGELTAERERGTEIRERLALCLAQVESLRNELSAAQAATEVAQARANSLERELNTVRTEAEARLDAEKSEHQRRITELHGVMTAQEQAFRAEINKATERLEGVQRHVMLQVEEARDATKQAEDKLNLSMQNNASLTAEVEGLKGRLAAEIDRAARADAISSELKVQNSELQKERATLAQRLAVQTGKSEALEAQIVTLEQRGVNLMEELLRRPPPEDQLKSTPPSSA